MARQADLLTVEEARARILAAFERLDTEEAPLSGCSGRVLARSVSASFDVPPFSNSSMDGFALVSVSTASASPESPTVLQVVAQVAAGSTGNSMIASGQCARIMTGAPLPSGADAVIPFEEVVDRGSKIVLTRPVPAGSCVRPAGQDIRSGGDVLASGTELHAPQIGLLAALGFSSVPVVRRPRVAILSTGDELVPAGTPLLPGQIYNSNAPMLAAAVEESGGRAVVLPAARDDPDELAASVQAAEGCDLLLTSGGASVGDFDYVKDVVGRGGELAFWRVRVRPGKPLLFGRVGAQRVIGLPGNPTSSMVTFEEFVRPAIRRMLGAHTARATVTVRLDEPIDNHGGRRTYARARLAYRDGEWHASLAGPQDSAMLVPLAHADGLVIVPEDRLELRAGEQALMQVWRLPDGGF